LAREAAWVPQARGKAVKIVAQLLPLLPASEHYQVIFIERDLCEVIASQKAMLSRQGLTGASLDSEQLAKAFRAQLRRVHAHLGRRPEFRVLSVNYGMLLANPAAGTERLARFLGGSFNARAATESVRPELRRQRG